MTPFEQFFAIAETYGIFHFYLPFLLVLTLFYGVLQKVKIFGEGGNKLNLIISVVASLYVIIYSPASGTISSFLSKFFAESSLAMITLLVGAMIFSVLSGFLFEGDALKNFANRWVWLAALLAIIALAGIFMSSGGVELFAQVGLPLLISAEGWVMIILVLVTALVIWLMAGEPKKEEAGAQAGGRPSG